MSHSNPAMHDSHKPPTTSTVEEDNVDIKAVLGFGIGLAVVTIVAHLLMLWMWTAEVAHVDASNPPRMFPLAVLDDSRQPPEPRLQTDPKQDLKDLRAAEEVVLRGYSWVDRNQKIVRIPVEDAIKLTLQRGLPSRPQAGAAQAPNSPSAATQATQERK
jgi:hypothetical protein